MSERLIPISRKQHDAIAGLTAGIQQAQKQLETMARTLLLGVDDDLGQVGIVGARCLEGVCSLVIDVPDIAPDTGPAPVA